MVQICYNERQGFGAEAPKPRRRIPTKYHIVPTEYQHQRRLGGPGQQRRPSGGPVWRDAGQPSWGAAAAGTL